MGAVTASCRKTFILKHFWLWTYFLWGHTEDRRDDPCFAHITNWTEMIYLLSSFDLLCDDCKKFSSRWKWFRVWTQIYFTNWLKNFLKSKQNIFRHSRPSESHLLVSADLLPLFHHTGARSTSRPGPNRALGLCDSTYSVYSLSRDHQSASLLCY